MLIAMPIDYNTFDKLDTYVDDIRRAMSVGVGAPDDIEEFKITPRIPREQRPETAGFIPNHDTELYGTIYNEFEANINENFSGVSKDRVRFKIVQRLGKYIIGRDHLGYDLDVNGNYVALVIWGKTGTWRIFIQSNLSPEDRFNILKTLYKTWESARKKEFKILKNNQ